MKNKEKKAIEKCNEKWTNPELKPKPRVQPDKHPWKSSNK